MLIPDELCSSFKVLVGLCVFPQQSPSCSDAGCEVSFLTMKKKIERMRKLRKEKKMETEYEENREKRVKEKRWIDNRQKIVRDK